MSANQDGLYDYFVDQDCDYQPEPQPTLAAIILTNLGRNPFGDETVAEMHTRLQREIKAEQKP